MVSFESKAMGCGIRKSRQSKTWNGPVISSDGDVLTIKRNVGCTPMSGMTNVEKCALDLMKYGKFCGSKLCTGSLI